MPTPSDPPDFWLQLPVARSFAISCNQCRFNDPRDYSFLPNKLQLHEGIDLAATDASGQPVAVLAAQRGTVDKVGFSAQGYGNYIRIVHPWHDGTWITWYGHLSSVQVREGDFVTAGQQIGIAGTTGFSSGIHLHLTLQRIGHGLDGYVVDDVVDPEPYLRLGTPPLVNEVSFVSDVTVADGTLMQPGQRFVKTWRVRNTGTTTWGSGYRLSFVQGSQMGAPASVPLPPAGPGQVVDVSVTFTAPTRPGRYRSTWQGRDAQGQLFNFSQYVEIEVVGVAVRQEASWVADVTVADGTSIPAGQTFLKTWRIRNTGNTEWGSGYRLAFFGHDRMNGPDSVPLPPARPGEEVDVSVSLTAPSSAGIHRSTWKPLTPQGDFFEFEQYVEIDVPSSIPPGSRLDEARFVVDVTMADGTMVQAGQLFTKTWRIRNSGTTTWGAGHDLAFFAGNPMGTGQAVPLPPAAPGRVVDVSVVLRAPTAAGTYRSTWKPRNPAGQFFDFELYTEIQVTATIPPSNVLDEARYVADVTIPDGTPLPAGQPFVKTWRMRNSGTTTWGAGYELVFFGDEPLGGPAAVALPPAVPGQEVDVEVTLTAPTMPGLYRSTWKPRSPDGRFFEFAMYAEILVLAPPNPGRVDDAQFVAHVTAPVGAALTPGETFMKTWRVLNRGETAWAAGYTLAFAGGAAFGGPESVALASAIDPGKATNVSVSLTAPTAPGDYVASWRLRNPAGQPFGDPLVIDVKVAAGPRVDLLAYLRGDGRLYELHYTWNGGGQQRVQTQRESSATREKFYHVKGSEWEELWSDNEFIYRGVDTSPGDGSYYVLSEHGQQGSPWVPRQMPLNVFFRRSPTVTFYRKDTCQVVNRFTHVTWIRLEAVHAALTLTGGQTLNDVVELAAYPDEGGRPGQTAFERYFYARNYGLGAWRGGVGESFLVEEHAPGTRPDNVREVIPCLS
ncbi:MAG: peptidoglycan DD-metalloendopeptidase family protein [Anaerolineales bacterium]|nr:peptidoglycan DD-metalloendopeptidase family protein [Anaerolineales bacterium]